MDVYIIPLAPERFELYCEPGEEREEPEDPRAGFFARMVERFRVKLTQLDRMQGSEREGEPQTWLRRVRHRIERWVAEKVAEQRLLWRLRKYPRARAFYPAELSPARATTIVERLLQRDLERHRFWTIIDGIGFVVTTIVLGPFFAAVPGIANLPMYYFAFRTLGHYLSMRGARHGLNSVVWTYEPCEPLTVLSHVLRMPLPERQRCVLEVATRLKLAHLPRFFNRAADQAA